MEGSNTQGLCKARGEMRVDLIHLFFGENSFTQSSSLPLPTCEHFYAFCSDTFLPSFATSKVWYVRGETTTVSYHVVVLLAAISSLWDKSTRAVSVQVFE